MQLRHVFIIRCRYKKWLGRAALKMDIFIFIDMGEKNSAEVLRSIFPEWQIRACRRAT
jgi:hypothetical protein